MVKAVTWIDGEASVLARKHALQIDFVKSWIVKQRITTDMIERYYKLPSGDLLEIIYKWL